MDVTRGLAFLEDTAVVFSARAKHSDSGDVMGREGKGRGGKGR